jgi:MRG-binding protein
MPPRKKTKGSTRATSTPVEPEEDAMAIDTPQVEAPPNPSYDMLKDPWTDEQETSLFKGVIKWKPAGQFKNNFKKILNANHSQACTNTFA